MATNRLALCLLISAVVFVGCGGSDGPQKYEVTGLVTMNGKPIEEGEIRFLSPDGRGTVGAAKIEAGQYTLMSEAGTKRVEIRSAEVKDNSPMPAKAPGGMTMPRLKFEVVPKKYNQESILTANVTSDGENHFDFELEK